MVEEGLSDLTKEPEKEWIKKDGNRSWSVWLQTVKSSSTMRTKKKTIGCLPSELAPNSLSLSLSIYIT